MDNEGPGGRMPGGEFLFLRRQMLGALRHVVPVVRFLVLLGLLVFLGFHDFPFQ